MSELLLKHRNAADPYRHAPDQQLKDEQAPRVMRLLEKDPQMSRRDLAQRVRVSSEELNYCLKALITKGFVRRESFHNSTHKFKYAYVLTHNGMAQRLALTSIFLRRKLREYELLKHEIDALTIEVSIKSIEAQISEQKVVNKRA